MSSIINRRVFFKVAATGVTGYMVSPMQLFPQSGITSPANILGTAKNVVFILLPGAPSHVDTFDLKVGAWTPANFAPSTVNGLDWPTGLLPNLGTQLSQNRLAVVRSCQAPALVHSLLQTWTQTGRSPASATGTIAPNVGSVVALEKEIERQSNQPVPGFLSLNGGVTIAGPGYFPGRYSAFDITPAATGIAGLANQDGPTTFNTRYNMLTAADSTLAHSSMVSTRFDEMADFYSSAKAMMYDPRVTSAFQFNSAAGLADANRYGTGTAQTSFGNACLTARNVLAAKLGVRFIQINLGGWDNHTGIYPANGVGGVYTPGRQLDFGLANLIADLAALPGSQGTLLDDTLIIARGEFGRTIGALTAAGGRDHYFNYSALVAGGGVRGGRAIGSTTPDGAFVDNPGWSQGRPIYSEDFAATIYSAMGINYRTTRHDDPLGRGFEYVATTGTNYIGEPIAELFT
jgi:hypothetical protein